MLRTVRSWVVSSVLAATASAIVPMAHANLLVNGDFSQHGDLTGPGIVQQDGGSFYTVAPSSNVVTGWTVTGINVDYKNTYWDAPSGPGFQDSWSIDTNGTSNPPGSGNAKGGIQQSFATTAGKTYDVSFYIAGNPDGPPDTKTLLVQETDVTSGVIFNQNFAHFTDYTLVGGVPVHNTRHAIDGQPGMNWTLETLSFTAIGSLTTLDFISQDNGEYGAALGHVDVEEEPTVHSAPEPTSLTLLGLGGLGLFGMVRRRRS
jgi:hypothetical protein